MATTTSIVAQRLRALRSVRRMSQEALAEKSGRSIETISNIERGTSSPTIETLEDLASALGVKVVDLLDEVQAGSDELLVMTVVAAVRKLDRAKLEVAARQVSALSELKPK